MLVALSVVWSCQQKTDPWSRIVVSDKPLPKVTIHRYELDLFSIPPSHLADGLARLAPRYPLFIGTNFQSEQALIQMKAYLNDPAIKQGFEAVEKMFVDITGCERDLSKAFQRLQVVVPHFRMPEVYTYVSGFDTETGIFVNDSVVIIPLDQFLGEGFSIYNKLRIPAYVQRNMNPEDIVPEVIRQILYFYFWGKESPSLLIEQMVYSGKFIALMEFVLPHENQAKLFRFTPAQLVWCQRNANNIWAMLVEKQMLFSADPAVIRTIMNDGPFTPGLDKESPARIGEWVGYQIVKSYLAKNPSLTPAQLFKTPFGQEFLRQSGYKPVND